MGDIVNLKLNKMNDQKVKQEITGMVGQRTVFAEILDGLKQAYLTNYEATLSINEKLQKIKERIEPNDVEIEPTLPDPDSIQDVTSCLNTFVILLERNNARLLSIKRHISELI